MKLRGAFAPTPILLIRQNESRLPTTAEVVEFLLLWVIVNIILQSPFVNHFFGLFIVFSWRSDIMFQWEDVKVLKKYQVLIPEWLEEYIKYLAEKYDLSFSEIIRSEVCFSIICTVTHFFPEFKSSLKPQELLELAKERLEKGIEGEEMHRLLSKVYFEARKAVEHRLSKESPKKK